MVCPECILIDNLEKLLILEGGEGIQTWLKHWLLKIRQVSGVRHWNEAAKKLEIPQQTTRAPNPILIWLDNWLGVIVSKKKTTESFEKNKTKMYIKFVANVAYAQSILQN